MRPFSLGLLGLLFTLATAPALDAQQAEQLRIAVVVEDPGSEAEFTDRQLEDAVTVLLTTKAPDVRIDSDGRVWLYIVPGCLDQARGWSCSLAVSLQMPAVGWTNPFRAWSPSVRMWEAHVILSGVPGDSFPRVREALDQMLDEPLAAWRRLSEAQRGCWTRFLNKPWLDAGSWQRWVGPCDISALEKWEGFASPAREDWWLARGIERPVVERPGITQIEGKQALGADSSLSWLASDLVEAGRIERSRHGGTFALAPASGEDSGSTR
jgi:hypothetical protein